MHFQLHLSYSATLAITQRTMPISAIYTKEEYPAWFKLSVALLLL
jgi:hypothetical protein